MQGIIYDIQRFCYNDGPGIRTVVFLKGCPLRCKWCHNPESQNQHEETMYYSDKQVICGEKVEVKNVMEEVLSDSDYYFASNGGVTISGGEPFMQHLFLKELLQTCKKHGIHTAIETSGYCQKEKLLHLMRYIDLFMYDVKLLTNDKHKYYTGVYNDTILSNLQAIIDSKANVEVKIPLIKGINSDDELVNIVKFLKKMGIKSIELLPYHNIYKDKLSRLKRDDEYIGFDIMTKDEIDKQKELVRSNGLNIVSC